MGVIVRELVAFLGIDFDRRGAAEADSRLKTLKSTMSTLAQVAGAGVIARGMWAVVESASAVEEQMNVIQQTFKENTQGVLEWSERVGKEMGRSQYSMREMVGAFGALLGPSQKNLQVTTDMSEGLTRLAVDLASFYNISDSEAQTRLFSAMTGETEAV
ncbi:MAG TPA: hypothetical protein VFO36_10445, partial [Nitrospiraceae bacterium]|nr:hypothetical protein [Nitrospiraceae bacterium]